MARSERVFCQPSLGQLSKRGDSLTDHGDIRVVGQWLNLVTRSRITDVGNNSDHFGAHLRIRAPQISIQFRQLPFEFAELHEINVNLILLTAVESVREVVDAIGLARRGECEREGVTDVWLLFLSPSILERSGIVMQASEAFGGQLREVFT